MRFVVKMVSLAGLDKWLMEPGEGDYKETDSEKHATRYGSHREAQTALDAYRAKLPRCISRYMEFEVREWTRTILASNEPSSHDPAPTVQPDDGSMTNSEQGQV